MDDPNAQTFCIGVGGDKRRPLPPASSFALPQLDTDQWAAVAASFGARYAVLTAMHCSGFALWPTNISSVYNYTYSVANAGTGTDIVDSFVQSFRARGLGVGAYYRCGGALRAGTPTMPAIPPRCPPVPPTRTA